MMIGLLELLAVMTLLQGDSVAPPVDQVDFDRDVRPILSDRCYQCHGPDAATRDSGLRLDTPEELFGDRGGYFPVVPGNLPDSELHRRIHADTFEQMPPADSNVSLSDEEKQTLDAWIMQGAKYREHWAFELPLLPQRPALPPDAGNWVQNEIDEFIIERLLQAGLEPSPEADRGVLIRRVTLDLTGLPPTLAEVKEFREDTSPNAYEKVVDRLLASEHYGERMAQPWLDAARYADSGGYQHDFRRTQWPWRDWVIRAYNDNMPFDQFTIEQLAGDLLPDASEDQRLATAFNRNHRINAEGGVIPEEWRIEYVADRLETMSTVWLGLTIGCARCHDHKYDPVSQREFYELFSFFNNIDEIGNESSIAPEPRMMVYTGGSRREHDALQAELTSLQRQQQRLLAGQPDEAFDWLHQEGEPRPDRQPLEQILRSPLLEADLHDPRTSKRIDCLKKKLEDFESQRMTAVSVMEELPQPRPTYLLVRGAYDAPDLSAPLGPRVPAFLPPLPEEFPRNRLGLAKWLFLQDHPLTARVSVNRFWQWHFGRGLVRTPEDFGMQGERPSHPELLDWLAVAFRDSGWDVKALQKRIVMTATYRQSSRVTPKLLQLDPENRLLARGSRFRLDAQALRDQALAASGLLVRQLGGGPVMPYQPEGLWEEVSAKRFKYVVGTGSDLYRRSLYTFWRRTVPPPSMMNFDAVSRDTCSVSFTRTNTPLQAMNLLNDPQFVEAARVLAQRMMSEGGTSEAERIVHGHKLLLSRAPNDLELDVLLRGYRNYLTEFRRRPRAAGELLSIGESTPPDDLDPVPLAALTVVACLLLNLDETVTRE